MTTTKDPVAMAAVAALAERYPEPSTISNWSWLPKSDWTCGDAARAYARHGFTVVLLHSTFTSPDGEPACTCSRGGACTRKGKHPRYGDWPNLPGDDPQVVSAWYGHWSRSNVGLVTGGASRLFVLDVDVAKGGFDSLLKLEAEHGGLPPTLRARTPSGGIHIYFHVPDGLTLPGGSQGKVGPGLDVRCDRGLVVAPPSRTELGQYAWEGHV